jgi:hypothetical protein
MIDDEENGQSGTQEIRNGIPDSGVPEFQIRIMPSGVTVAQKKTEMLRQPVGPGDGSTRA